MASEGRAELTAREVTRGRGSGRAGPRDTGGSGAVADPHGKGVLGARLVGHVGDWWEDLAPTKNAALGAGVDRPDDEDFEHDETRAGGRRARDDVLLTL